MIPAPVRIDCSECGHRGVRDSADPFEASPDQHGHVGVGPCDSTKDLPLPGGCLDIADANLEMPFTAMTAADEGRINGDGDRRRGSPGLDPGSVAQLLARLEGMAA